MIRKRPTLVTTVIAAVASAVILAAGPISSQAQTHTGRGARSGAAVNARLQQAEALVQAYTLLVTANHDYAGHRAAAAHSVHQALKALHAGIAKHGGTTQQTTINQQIAAITAADKRAGQTTMTKERQPASDAQLAQAQQILAQVQQGMSGKQPRLLALVTKAVQEIQTALQTR